MVSRRENKALIRQYVEEVWNRGNLDFVDEVVSPDYVFTHPTIPIKIHGPEGLKQIIRLNREAFPDYKLTVVSMIAEGDHVAWRWTMRGTHQGEFLGIPPTGTQVTMTGIAIYRIIEGKIVDRWGEADIWGLVEQLKSIPSEG